jgi:hypothetical protein
LLLAAGDDETGCAAGHPESIRDNTSAAGNANGMQPELRAQLRKVKMAIRYEDCGLPTRRAGTRSAFPMISYELEGVAASADQLLV